MITIIIPVFNSEKYLKKCLDSVVSQTYKDLEIIVVEDGSTDASREMCDQYAEKDTRIKVIHKVNEGVSVARNIGLENAHGEYIGFVDSDDYIEPTMYEKLYEEIKKQNADIAMCGFNKVYENNDYDIVTYDTYEIMENKEQIKKYLAKCAYGEKETILNVVMWNKIYKINLFDKDIFPKNKIHEDTVIIPRIVYKADKMIILNDVLYNYYQSQDSITRKEYNKSRLDEIDAVEQNLRFFEEKNEAEIANSYKVCIRCLCFDHFNKYKEKFPEEIGTIRALFKRYFELTKELKKHGFK